MTRLSSRDLEHALSAVGEWHRAATLTELETAAIGALHELIPCEGVGWNEVDVAGKEVRALTSPHDYFIPEHVEALNRRIEQHPIVQYVARTGDTSATKISDFVSAREFHQLEIYDEFFRPLGVEDLLAVIVHTGSVIVGIAFTRARRDWLARDRALLNLLQPHLASAYASIATRLAAAQRIDELERGLEGRAVVRLTGDGRLEHLPDILERWFGRDAEAPAPGRYAREDVTLTVRQVDDDPTLLLLEERHQTPDPQRARELGLSRREAEVVGLAARGLADADIARELFISARTVSKHLQHAYGKLGVSSRREATVRLMGDTNPW